MTESVPIIPNMAEMQSNAQMSPAATSTAFARDDSKGAYFQLYLARRTARRRLLAGDGGADGSSHPSQSSNHDNPPPYLDYNFYSSSPFRDQSRAQETTPRASYLYPYPYSKPQSSYPHFNNPSFSTVMMMQQSHYNPVFNPYDARPRPHPSSMTPSPYRVPPQLGYLNNFWQSTIGHQQRCFVNPAPSTNPRPSPPYDDRAREAQYWDPSRMARASTGADAYSLGYYQALSSRSPSQRRGHYSDAELSDRRNALILRDSSWLK